MDLFRSWLYGREKPERFSPHFDKSIEKSSSATNTTSTNARKTVTDQHLNTPDQDPTTLERLLLKVVPLEPGDCLGCKIVGTSVMVASGIIVLTSAIAGRQRNPSLTGRKLTTYYTVCGCLFIGFETAAICRFFDVGPFGYLARLKPPDSNR